MVVYDLKIYPLLEKSISHSFWHIPTHPHSYIVLCLHTYHTTTHAHITQPLVLLGLSEISAHPQGADLELLPGVPPTPQPPNNIKSEKAPTQISEIRQKRSLP